MLKFKEKYLNYILIIIASIIICIPLLSKNLNIYTDDGIQHICRLIGTYQTLESKQFLPMIMSNFCNNFGYSWNIFYSPLTAYTPLLFKVLGLTYIQSLKLFMFVVTLLSGIAMYKFMLKVTKNKNIAVLSAIIYVLAPYRITDMYIRTAIAELASFIFLPIIFNGMYTIINEEKNTYLLAWGTIGLILTHTVITLYTAILCFIYLSVFIIIKCIKKDKNIKIILWRLTKNIIFAILATSFYWVPLLQHYFATSYEVFVPGRMQRLDVLEYYKVRFYELFYTTKDQIMIYAIGLVTVVGLIITPIAYKKILTQYKKTYIIFLIFGIVLTIMTLTLFPFEKLPNMLTMIQFTFRLFEFTSFFFAVVAGINYGLLIKNFGLKDISVLTIIMVLLLIPYKYKLDFNIKYDENNLISPVPLSSETGRVHAGMASMEYMPSKMFNNLDYVINRKDEPIILEENGQKINQSNLQAKIVSYNKNGTNMKLELENVQEDTIIELPYTYYLGYRIYVNGEEIEYTESDNGFIQIKINEQQTNDEISVITVKYLGTNAMIISVILSIITYVILLIVKLKT